MRKVYTFKEIGFEFNQDHEVHLNTEALVKLSPQEGSGILDQFWSYSKARTSSYADPDLHITEKGVLRNVSINKSIFSQKAPL